MDVDTTLQVVNTYNIFLSSAFRSNGTTNNYSINLVKPLLLTNPNNSFSVRVGSCEIPYSFKLINPSNNIINYEIIRNSITYTSSITLETGNFNILDLLQELKSKLASSILLLTGWNASTILNFTYNRGTGKATFSFSPTDAIGTTISILSASSVFLKCIGFFTYPSFSYTSPASITPAISQTNVNVSQNTAIYIRSENLTQVTNFESVVSSSEYSDIIAKVQIASLPGTIIQWTNSTDLEIDITNKVIDKINLYIGDAQNYELDLGGLDWTCRLTIIEWSEKKDSHNKDYIPESIVDPTVYNDLMKTKEKAMKRLEKLKNKVFQDEEKNISIK